MDERDESLIVEVDGGEFGRKGRVGRIENKPK